MAVAAVGAGLTAVAGAVGITVAATTITTIATGIVVGAVVGGVSAAISGGNILKGALMGGLVGGVTAGIGAALSPAAGGATGGLATGEAVAEGALEVATVSEAAGLEAGASLGNVATGAEQAVTPFSYKPTTLTELVPGVDSAGYAPSVTSTASKVANSAINRGGLAGQEIAKQAGTAGVKTSLLDSIGDRTMAVGLTGISGLMQKAPATAEEIAAAQKKSREIYAAGNVAAAPTFSKPNTISSISAMDYYRKAKQGVAAA